MIFQSPTFGKVTIEEAANQILSFIKTEPNYQYNIIVGSDSQNYTDKTWFVTAIIVHRKGAGGRFFWRRLKKEKVNVLRNRIYEETCLSMQIANALTKILNEKTDLIYNLEIHVDIGPNGKTKEFIKEIVGMLKGIGLNVKTKPDAYGASTIADRFTK